jgi:hypothetical protein
MCIISFGIFACPVIPFDNKGQLRERAVGPMVSRSAVSAATRVRFLESTLGSHRGLPPYLEFVDPGGLPQGIKF